MALGGGDDDDDDEDNEDHEAVVVDGKDVGANPGDASGEPLREERGE